MYRLQNTLRHDATVLSAPDNGTVRVEVEQEKRLQVPLHHLGAIVCFGNVLVSPALMHALAEAGKSLVLLDEHGRFKARLEGGRFGQRAIAPGSVLGCLFAGEDPRARPFVCRWQLRNGRTVILRAARESDSEQNGWNCNARLTRWRHRFVPQPWRTI